MMRLLRPEFPAAATVCLLMAFAQPLHAQDAERPLGILFPGVQQPAPQVRSPIPPIPHQQTGTGSPAASTAPKSSAADATDRPLGSLFNAPAEPVRKTGSVLPRNWASNPARVSAPTGQDTTTTGSATRPLGTLINLPQARPTSAGAQTSGAAVQAREVQPAHKAYATPGSDATDAKPLGTLFGSSPRIPKDRTTGISSDKTKSPEPIKGTATAASSVNQDLNVLRAELSADSMTYDRDLGLVVATGNVGITYGTRSLIADKVSYNQKTDVVIADGNVSMTDQTGKVLFGDKVEITGDLKDGIIYNIGLVLEDKSRVAGAGARRSNAEITEISRAVYSPCNLCKDDPSAAPLWQIKAIRVIHDSEQKQISYRNAWLEVYGIPVAYTPYLSHPDPTVKRRSGFLAPTFSNSSDLGLQLRTPYFWAIDEHQDATFAPMLATDGGQGAIGQFRRNFKHGSIIADGNFVVDDPDKGSRGYIDLETEYHIDPTWRAGLKVETASDDTYTRRYGFDTEPVLVSRGYLEGFRGQNYQALNTYAFNDLRQEEESGDSPIVLPMYDFNYSGKRDRAGGFASFDFNALNIIRDSGTDTRRFAFRPRWDRPFNGSFGEIYNASVSLAADAYHASDVTRDDGSSYTGMSGRFVPRASLSWRLPLIRPGENFSQTIEPLASVTVAPNGGNPDKIPNEDSQEIEFDETNLFQDNRYDGFDRVDGGTRFNYGLNWVLTGNEGGSTSVFLGQSYRPRIDSSYSQSSGLEDNFSDFVGRVQISPQKYLNMIYRTQFSPDNLSPQRNELSANIGTPAFNVNTDYIFINQKQGSEFSGREEINGGISSEISKNWSTYVRARHDLSASDLRSLGFGIVYEDECIKFTSQFSRSYFEDRDLRPSDAVTFTVVLKTLGEIHSGASRLQ
ncbi:LPS assembly protein LptD [Thalassospiraceae bacterium LMO-JJ14]|nr:LPS assembly protein LptD [Thalassospiraceae bacterium LMO-JJ14]